MIYDIIYLVIIMIEFTKMEGTGNDYIYVDLRKNKIQDLAKFAKKYSNRHFSIGSDGLVTIDKSDKADFKFRIFNADGSEAEMCGNGIRCAAVYYHDKINKKENLTVETKSGIKHVWIISKNMVKVDMGSYSIDPKEIPINYPANKLKLKIKDREFDFTGVSTGNPHVTTIINDIDTFNIKKYGPLIENNEIFPERINTEFLEIIDKNNIKMRVWERGSGETLACGTGACAAAITSYLNGYTNNKVTVHLKGGNLLIEVIDNKVYMTGPANYTFEGKVEESY